MMFFILIVLTSVFTWLLITGPCLKFVTACCYTHTHTPFMTTSEGEKQPPALVKTRRFCRSQRDSGGHMSVICQVFVICRILIVKWCRILSHFIPRALLQLRETWARGRPVLAGIQQRTVRGFMSGYVFSCCSWNPTEIFISSQKKT